jgi:acetyl esterase/lipase
MLMRAAMVVVAAFLITSAAVGCGGEGDDAGPDTALGGARVAWGEPTGDPKGLVMLIHGGGWQPSDSEYEQQRQNARSLQDQGYATVAIGYDEGAKGFRQVVEVYKEAREQYPNLPICASGISAGGHLALMLAVREPDLDCVLALAAPTDLTTLAEDDPSGDEAYRAAVKAFGEDRLAEFSPLRYADRIKAKVLMIIAESDPIAPVAQDRKLAAALPGAELVVLPPGPLSVPFAHFGGVQEDAQNVVIEEDLNFLEMATEGS